MTNKFHINAVQTLKIMKGRKWGREGRKKAAREREKMRTQFSDFGVFQIKICYFNEQFKIVYFSIKWFKANSVK